MMGLQTMFAVLTVAVIMHVSCRIFGAPAAKLAGTFWAVSVPLIWLPAVLWETGLSTLLLIGMVALALRSVHKPARGNWLIMGACGGLAMLVNPSLMLALSAILGWTVHQTRAIWRPGPWVCLLTWLAVFAPWPLRNARVLHAFIPLQAQQLRIRGMAGKPPRSHQRFRQDHRAARKQTGVPRLRGNGGGRVHAP